MNWKLPVTITAILALGGGVAYLILDRSPDRTHSATPAHDEHAHDEADAGDAFDQGPHGGRLLTDGNFTLELAIVEQGVPPEFRAWFTQAGKPLAPETVKLAVQLARPGGTTDSFTFVPEDGYARSRGVVAEPHSFDYSIVAEHAGRTHRWAFSAPEMQTTISAEMAGRVGIATELAGPATLVETLPVYGQVRLNENRIARAVPRFGGIVRETRKAIGDAVEADEIVAVIETNQSLVTLAVKAPIGGVVVDRDVNTGETVVDGATLYTIADLSDVWIDLNVPKRDHSRVKVGQQVSIEADDGGEPAQGTIDWIAPTGSADAQSLIARVVLPNPDHRWHAGLSVKGEITIAATTVPLAVKASGLQTLFAFTVVFSQHGDLYQARPLEIGRRSGGYVEVLKGLRPGERYVTENSFLLKADIGKSSAGHDH